ncbi:LCP family protein [Demequina oxidasica]|uniref:LCP family protein n=1 Tax=Demequina oxidasica TaxID=676199 RepID=UPI000ADF026A|nr:LCP family protein [Demequina oxidasica]
MTPTGEDNPSGQRDARRPMPPSIAPGSTPQRRSVIPPAQDQRQNHPPVQATHTTASREARSQPAPQPRQPQQPGQGYTPRQPKRRRKHHRCCVIAWVLIGALVLYWVAFLIWAQSNINSVDALSGAANTPGETYLIVGSDSREGWDHPDSTEGERTDTIMVLHKPESGPVALISIPRDSYVDIPGHDKNKINASFAWGGPPLLVETVEELTGLTIDDYFEIGFTGVGEIVDALGGVSLCYDQDVSDKNSKMEWEAGCHVVDGDEALAFSRMRYADPLGDIGRTQRQQQLVGAVAQDILSPATILNPTKLIPVTAAGLDAFRVSEGTGVFDLGKFALTLRSGMGGNAVTGTPPIKDLGYNVAGAGSTVLLDPDQIDEFWDKIANGEYEPGTEVGGIG